MIFRQIRGKHASYTSSTGKAELHPMGVGIRGSSHDQEDTLEPLHEVL
jgi:hypothetical protein